MTPGNVILAEVPALLAADATTLAPLTNPPKVILAQSSFVPNPNLDPSTVTPASFTGSTPLACIVGAQLTGFNPLTGNYLCDMKVPLGGWRWITGDAVNLPQTIFGFLLVDHTGLVLYGSALFPTPIPLNAAGQVVEIDEVRFEFVPTGIV
jgi:hypothetical protein